jgi:phospholipid/cholesterol/gamma-HCH transport system substrate-binding protein
MPRTRSLAFAELKIGILTVFALTMAGLLIFAVGGSAGFFWQVYPLKVIFADVASIKEGSPVRVAGVEVGNVTDVKLTTTAVEVWFQISKDVQPLVTTESRATLGSISLLGEGALDITAAPGGTSIPRWGYVRAGPVPNTIAQLTDEATAGMTEARQLIADLRAGKGTAGKLFTDESLYRELDAFVRSAENVASSVAQGRGTLGKLSKDSELYDQLHQSVENLNTITERIRSGEGSLGQLMNDPAFAKSLSATGQHFEELSAKLNRGEGTAGKLLNDDALYTRLDSMTARLDTVIRQLNEGQGTAGQLLRDKQLYENMNQAASELRGLIQAIRKDPRKYLNVKVSIF